MSRLRRLSSHLVGLALLALAGCASTAAPGQRVDVPLLPTPGAPSTVATLPVWLTRPAGPAPYPTIILLHTCGGLAGDGGAGEHDAGRFSRAGWLVAMPDSFTPRGKANVCADNAVTPGQRVIDARSVMHWLVAQGLADPARVVLLGRSHGAGTVVQAAARPPRGPDRFAAGIAYYPPCGPVTGVTAVQFPVLILIGGQDDWTRPGPCRLFARHVHEAGGTVPVRLHLYPEATHAFDQPRPAPANYLGHHLVFNPAAADDAETRVDAMLAHVAPAPTP
jgi:dienelactone hydrolase